MKTGDSLPKRRSRSFSTSLRESWSSRRNSEESRGWSEYFDRRRAGAFCSSSFRNSAMSLVWASQKRLGRPRRRSAIRTERRMRASAISYSAWSRPLSPRPAPGREIPIWARMSRMNRRARVRSRGWKFT
jgi:hypothetical protein